MTSPRVVVLAPLPEGGFSVRIEPPIADRDGVATFWLKDDAFGAARSLAREHFCGLRDESEGNTGNANAKQSLDDEAD